MAKFDKKLSAFKLRRQGKSINEIAKTLDIAKSTASIWCREVVLTPLQKNRLRASQIAGGHYGRMLGAAANKRKKEENIVLQEQEAKKLVGNLSERDRFMIGIGLYWGEGVKSLNSTGVSLVNSDPEIVRFARDWFEYIGVKRSEFCPYIYISEVHRSREKILRKFWSTHLEIPEKQFNKVTFLKGRPKKVYENHDSYYGILALRIRKSTSLKYKILGLLKACRNTPG